MEECVRQEEAWDGVGNGEYQICLRAPESGLWLEQLCSQLRSLDVPTPVITLGRTFCRSRPR